MVSPGDTASVSVVLTLAADLMAPFAGPAPINRSASVPPRVGMVFAPETASGRVVLAPAWSAPTSKLCNNVTMSLC
eukprot:scaffold3906_cov120-Isochrysis_galbana.AAC.4